MRASKIAMLIAGLALWGGPAFAQPSQPRYSADGLYNLANSYARDGKPGLAVLSYERAALLAPDDPDINANLAYVRASPRR
jgi:Flp pilus assembly protein TadD